MSQFICIDRLVWAKETYEHLGFVYASGVAGGPTVGEVRPEDRPRKLEVVQIRICAPRDLSITSFADWRKDDPLTLHRDLGQWVSPRDQLTTATPEVPIEN
jgi:hypothetical protein